MNIVIILTMYLTSFDYISVRNVFLTKVYSEPVKNISLIMKIFDLLFSTLIAMSTGHQYDINLRWHDTQ